MADLVAWKEIECDHSQNPRGDVTLIPEYADPDGIIDQLAASIAEDGLLQPIIVAPPKKKGETYKVIAGFTRYAAIARLREASPKLFMQVPVVRKEGNSITRWIAALTENTARWDPQPLATARGLKQAMDLDPSLTQESLAKRIGRSGAWVSRKLLLLQGEPPVQAALREGTLPEYVACAIARLDAAEQGSALKKALADPAAYGREVADGKPARANKRDTSPRMPKGVKGGGDTAGGVTDHGEADGMHYVCTASDLDSWLDEMKETMATSSGGDKSYLKGAIDFAECLLDRNQKFNLKVAG